jgi:hypothetical protein
MFAGHVGVALAVGRVERRVNVGVFVIAALLLDVLLWLFVLLGRESVTIPADFAATHQPKFVFPYSHGLLAATAWSAVAGTVAAWLFSRQPEMKWRAGVLVAAAVFSHWLIDALVHRPELPLASGASAAVGLALWDNMPLALVIEAALVVLGLWLFLSGSRLSKGKSIALATLSLLILAFTIVGMTVAPPPPSAFAMAASSLVTLAVVCAAFVWLGRPPRPDVALDGAAQSNR